MAVKKAVKKEVKKVKAVARKVTPKRQARSA